MTVKLLTEHHLEILSLTGGYTCSSESTLVKMPHCWKSHVMAQLSSSALLHRLQILLSLALPINLLFQLAICDLYMMSSKFTERNS